MITQKIDNNENVSILRKDFMANLSHEMRTPLNAIVGFSEELLKFEMNQEQWQYITNIKRSSENLIHIVNNLMMFSVNNQEDIVKDETCFSLSKLVLDLTAIFEQKAKEKGIRFSVYLKNSPKNSMLFGDRQLLSQILYNLFDNCIKFTFSGNINAYFSVTLEKEKTILNINLTDTGIGLSNTDIDRIFNEYTQLDDSLTGKFGGIGLGLSICKKLVEQLNGNISVSGNTGQGTVFNLKIPYKKTAIAHQPHLSDIHYEEKMLNGKEFLVVDDDEYNRLLAKKRLQDWGASVDLCNDGHEALAKINHKKYFMILLDIHMPGISGIEVAKIIRTRTNNINNQTPILAVTATIKSAEQRNSFLEAGINEYLLKPYKEIELYDKIMSMSTTSGNMREIKTASPINDYNLEELITITKGDNEFLVIMLSTFLTINKENILELKQNYSKKDFIKISEIAHKMLNSYRQLKIGTILSDLEQLELLIDKTKIDSKLVLKHIEKIDKYSQKIFKDIEREVEKFS